jgi:hypothetical protein
MRPIGTILAVGLLVGCSGGNTVTPANGVAACATASSCDLLGQGGIQSCASNVLAINNPALVAFFRVPLSGSQVNCLAQAGKDCDAARKCLNNGMPPTSCSGTGPQSCVNMTTLQSCSTENGGNYTTQFDCSFYGEMCLSNNNKVACGTGTCSTAGSSCMVNVLQTCDANGFYHQTDCAQVGSTCVAGAVTSHCRGTGPTCTGPAFGLGDNSLRCDGDKLVNCFDSQEAPFDCTTLQTHCFANAKGVHAACALGNACDPANYQVVCMGTKLQFCNNGKVDTFDCAGGGWTTCKPDNGGSCG